MNGVAGRRERALGRDAAAASAGGRPRIVALALLAAVMTATVAVLFGAPPLGAAVFLAAGAAALFAPSLIVLEVVAGQLLVASLLSARAGAGAPAALAVFAAVILTAELLGVAARLNAPVQRDPTSDLRRAAIAAITGGLVFGIVLGAGRLPGPTGVAAVVVASAGCITAAFLLLSLHRGTLPWHGSKKDMP